MAKFTLTKEQLASKFKTSAGTISSTAMYGKSGWPKPKKGTDYTIKDDRKVYFSPTYVKKAKAAGKDTKSKGGNKKGKHTTKKAAKTLPKQKTHSETNRKRNVSGEFSGILIVEVPVSDAMLVKKFGWTILKSL